MLSIRSTLLCSISEYGHDYDYDHADQWLDLEFPGIAKLKCS